MARTQRWTLQDALAIARNWQTPKGMRLKVDSDRRYLFLSLRSGACETTIRFDRNRPLDYFKTALDILPIHYSIEHCMCSFGRDGFYAVEYQGILFRRVIDKHRRTRSERSGR